MDTKIFEEKANARWYALFVGPLYFGPPLGWSRERAAFRMGSGVA